MDRFGKGITKAEEKIFVDEYNQWMREILYTLSDYRNSMVQTMQNTHLKTFKSDKDFIETAKLAIFHKLLVIYQQEAAMEEVNNLISD